MKILIGPLLPDDRPRFNDLITLKEIAGNLTEEIDFRVFNHQVVQQGEKITYINDFAEVLAKLPKGWEPELIIFWRPEYEYVSTNLEKVKCPLVAVVGDWYLGFEYLWLNLERFDAIFTDQKGVEVLQKNGYNHAYYFPMWAHDPNLHKYAPKEKKIYDITFVGKLNHFIHKERAGWLYRLAKLSDRHKVKIFNGVWREDYVRILNQSKITFNYAMKHELNMRTYEALACKSLPLLEADNLEAPLLLEDRKEAVYYNETNFESLIDYYLKADKERQQIIEAGFQKIRNETYENHFRHLLDTIKNLNLKPRKRVAINADINLAQRVRTISCHFFTAQERLNYLRQTLGVFENQIRNKAVNLNNRGVLYCELANISNNRSYWQKAGESFAEALQQQATNPVILYNLGLLLLINTNYQEAEVHLQKLAEILSDHKLQPDLAFLIYKNNSDEFIMELNQLFQIRSKSEIEYNQAYRQLLRWKTYEYLGYLAELNSETVKALTYYQDALAQKTDMATTLYRIVKLQQLQGNYLAACQNSLKVLREQPFFIPNWYTLLELLSKCNEAKLKQKYLKEFITVLDSYAYLDPLQNQELTVIRQKLLLF